MVRLNNRVHAFASLSVRDKLVDFFTNVLGCGVVSLPAPGLATPFIAFTFPQGGSLSYEFTDDALDESQAIRGARLEITVDDAAALQEKILAAGVPQVDHPATGRFYFQVPGGQVIGIGGPERR